MRARSAFTLLEIMIVVAIIGLLVALALPSFMHARQEARNAAFIDDLRVATDAFQMYAAENGSFPPDANPGIVPTGMSTYFTSNFDFTATTPIGGNWDWEGNVYNIQAGLSVLNPTASVSQITEIDKRIDDGVLTTGMFYVNGGTRYIDVIAP